MPMFVLIVVVGGGVYISSDVNVYITVGFDVDVDVFPLVVVIDVGVDVCDDCC